MAQNHIDRKMNRQIVLLELACLMPLRAFSQASRTELTEWKGLDPSIILTDKRLLKTDEEDLVLILLSFNTYEISGHTEYSIIKVKGKKNQND